ncbi:hypothetical protein [Coleofasciculus sp.]|uniref:hypothetical protein n=1 Tax=Coleofasciculus sp. TaxID=3100458 RepID=UPI0039F7FDCC
MSTLVERNPISQDSWFLGQREEITRMPLSLSGCSQPCDRVWHSKADNEPILSHCD